MSLEIFSQLKKQKSLYPQEVIPMLVELFKQIWIDFDITETIKIQLGGRKKEEYEVLLKYLHEMIKNEDVEKWDWSTRYVLSKAIEKEIFKNLDFFYHYNIYNDKDRRNLKEKIDSILFKIYESLEDSESVLSEEIKLFIDWEEVIGKDKIELWLNSVKKNKIALSKLNLEYNNFLQEKEIKNVWLLPEIISDLDNKVFVDNTDKKIAVSEVNFILKNLNSFPEVAEDEKLFYFLSEQDFYYFKKWRLKKYTKDNKIILDLYLNRITRIENKKFSYGNVELLFSDDIIYYNSLNLSFFWFGQEKKNINKYIWDNILDKDFYNLFENENILKYDENWELLEKVVWIKQLNLNWRIYSKKKDIYTILSKIENDQPILVTFNDWKELLTAKWLEYFILFHSKDLIKSIKYKMITKSVEDKIIFKYHWVNLMKFSSFVNNFFKEIKEDYEYEFDWEKIK